MKQMKYIFRIQNIFFYSREGVEQNYIARIGMDLLLYRPTGLGNTRGIVLQYNSGLTELQGIGQHISPGEFYWKELVNPQIFNNSNKVAILVKIHRPT